MENENNHSNTVAEKTTKKKGKKKWIIIAIVLVLIILAASAGSSEPTVEPINGESTSADSSAVDTNSKETTQTPTSEIKVGSSVSNKEIKINYKSCNSDFKDYSYYADVKSGYKIVEAVFDFENISSSDVYLNSFQCYADGVKCDSFFYVDDYSDPSLELISSGRKLLDATVYYEVPVNAELIELEYEADYWSEEKFIFIIE